MNDLTKKQLTKRDKILEWMKEQFESERELTNWHLSDQFIEFWKTFFKEEDAFNVRKKFNYYANILVKEGVLGKAKRHGIGLNAMYDFGARTQTVWGEPTNTVDRLEKLSKKEILQRI